MIRWTRAFVCTALPVVVACSQAGLPAKDVVGGVDVQVAETERLIQVKGTKAALDELNDDSAKWGAILDGMATGKQAWLKLLVEFYKVSDGGAALDLQLVAADVVQKAPAAALESLVPTFTLEILCGNENSIGETLEEAQKIIGKRRLAVVKLTDPKIEERKVRCLALLDELEKSARKNADSWFPQ